MNERIKQLWDQAAKLEPDPSWEGQTKFMEKFAKMIVEECISQAEKEEDRFFEMGEVDIVYSMQNFQLLLKNHFGFEEPPACKHDWYSAKNPVVQNGSVCVKCGAIDPREPEELKNES